MSEIFKTIPMEFPPTMINFHPYFKAMCSIGKEPFDANCNIAYCPSDRLIEFESFERWLGEELNIEKEVTIEQSAFIIFDAIRAVLGDIPCQVTVDARTTVHEAVYVHYSNHAWRQFNG